MSKNLISFWVSMVFFAACAHPKVTPTVEVAPPPAHAYQTSNPDQETIAVVGINDLHGNLFPREKKLPDGTVIKSGGAQALGAMIKILREEMPGRVAIIDAGDEWQGTLESNLSKGANVVDFYNLIGVNAAAIGNHEFDFGVPTMNEQFARAHYPYVASNIFKKKSGLRPNWKNFAPSRMIEVAGYKIGVVGVSTLQTPTTTRYENVADLNFKDPLKPVVKEAGLLRKAGANLVLVTAHAGTTCNDKNGLKEWKLWNAATQTSSCDETGEIYQLAEKLKPGQVDGIIAGHTHQIIHHFIHEIPVVQGEAYNQYFNVMYFTFDRKTHALVSEQTEIEGLIPICFETFVGTNHCDVRRLPKDQSPKWVKASFHGHGIEPDAKIEAWIKPILESTEKYRKEVIAYTELPLPHYRDQESPLGNLMADVLREKAHSDFALVNSGGIRASLDAGAITYEDLYRALPFDNLLNVLQMTGKQIKLLFRLATSGTRGWPGFSGARITVIPLNQNAPMTDLNHDGKLEKWETNRILKIVTDQGQAIDDHKLYTLATYDFLVTGGDDLKFVMDQIPKNRILREKSGYCRDLATEYLLKHPKINTKEHPLFDPKNPRIILQPNP
jgi:5'-nucleotidase